MSGGLIVLFGVASPLGMLALVLWWNEKHRGGRDEFLAPLLRDDVEVAVLEEAFARDAYTPGHEREEQHDA